MGRVDSVTLPGTSKAGWGGAQRVWTIGRWCEMAYNDGVRIGPVAYIGLVSALVLVVLVLALQVLYYQQNNEKTAESLANAGPPPERADLAAKQATALTQRGYVDRQRGIVAVGIQRGMDLVLKDLADGKSPEQARGPAPPAPVS